MNPYTISEFITYLQGLADGHGDKPLTLMFTEADMIWDVDEIDVVSDELVEDDNRIYVTLL